jgi:hypothetical protein
MPSYRIGRLKGQFVIVFEQDGKRRRYRLRATDKSGAEHEAPGIYAELTRPTGTTVGELWNAYLADRADRAIVSNMPHT